MIISHPWSLQDMSRQWFESIGMPSLYILATYMCTQTLAWAIICAVHTREEVPKQWISGCNSFSLYIALWWHSVWDKGWTRRKNNLSILLLGFFCATIIFFFFNIHTFHGIKTSIQVSHLCIVFKIQWGTMRPQKYGHIKRLWNKREEMREIHCIGSTESWWISVY